MTPEALGVPEDGFGSLRGCLVEGDPLSEKRARRLKRRAVGVSIMLQTVSLATLVVFPLLSKGERIALQYVTPIPPYAPVGNHQHSTSSDPGRRVRTLCRICVPTTIPPRIITRDRTPSQNDDENDGDLVPPGEGTPGGLTPTNDLRPVRPKTEDALQFHERRKVSELQQMAQLINRVEPGYPQLAIQTHREGRVELHAIISTEGKIESLEVISGDPFFIQSALSAVRQWRYRPTILNGRPVEIDTHITVIYTLSR